MAVAGLAAALLMSSAAFSGAHAWLFDFGGQAAAPYPALTTPAPKARRLRHKRIDRIDRNEKKLPALASGSLQIVIAIDKQRLTLYSDGVAVAHSIVSTGVPGHSTPTGVFSVIQKERFHRSNLYSDAPMPFMQRITWSGVALHEGFVPGHPASHGCIRMPGAFARQMWATTKLGVRVIIARTDVVPVEIENPHLFVPRQVQPETPPEIPVADQPARKAETDRTIRTAEMTDPVTATDATELRGSVKDSPISEEHGLIATITAAAALTERLTGRIAAAEAAIAVKAGDVAAAAHTVAVVKKAADHIHMVEAMRKSGPISVFISRKEKKLFVRHKFMPLFDAPVTIRDANVPFGTHVYTAIELKDGGAAMRWTVMSLPTGAQNNVEPPKKHGRNRKTARPGPEPPAVTGPPSPAAIAALDRIEIGKETLDRIGELLTPGASLTISDQGLGPETGRGTDFIVVTR